MKVRKAYMNKGHYDNKNDLLRELKKRKLMADNAITATFSTYMIMSLYVLMEDFEYDQENVEAYREKFCEHLAEYEDGKLTVKEMEKQLFDNLGVVVEMPKMG